MGSRKKRIKAFLVTVYTTAHGAFCLFPQTGSYPRAPRLVYNEEIHIDGQLLTDRLQKKSDDDVCYWLLGMVAIWPSLRVGRPLLRTSAGAFWEVVMDKLFSLEALVVAMMER